MDETEIDGWRQALLLLKEEHKKKTFTSSEDLRQSLRHLKEAREEVTNFILPSLDGDGTIDIRGWREAHEAITSVWESTEPTKVEVLLPKFSSTQAKRRRLESKEFLMFRPVFKRYEEEIFGVGTNDDGVKGIFGLNGPQGFGKSVFLHCLALKRAFGKHLVVWVPSCPNGIEGFKKSLATAFYRGSQAQALNWIPYMKKSDQVSASLDKMQDFAATNDLLLLVIVNQMHRHLDYFDKLKKTLEDFSLSFEGQGHRVIMSSSTSGTVGSVFGSACFSLKVFDHFLSPNDITLLTSHFHASANLDLVKDGEWSFLQAFRLLSGPATTLEQEASDFTTRLEATFRADTAEVSEARKVQYMRVLHMVVAKQASFSRISFDSNLVDGDLFFVKTQSDSKHIMCEHMQGFANQVLHSIKETRNYEEYLRFVIGSVHFESITRGAQGSILEDAISYLLQNKNHPIKFALTGLGGKTGLHRIASIQLDDKRYVKKFTTVPKIEDCDWAADKEWFVGIPPEGFTGIDFVLARTRVVKMKAVEIFFIQSTVSTPQEHGVKKSAEQEQLKKLLSEKAGVTHRGIHLFVTFLTPRLGTENVTANMEYEAENYYHSKFQMLEGKDSLAKIISDRCKSAWGN